MRGWAGLVWTTAIAGCVAGAGCNGDGRALEETFVARSDAVGDIFDVRVSVPVGGYDGGARFGVVYLLDPQWGNFDNVKNAMRAGGVEPVILVGVSSIRARDPSYSGEAPTRCHDLTPTRVATGICSATSGGGLAFADFLATEVVPLVDARYPTIADPAHRTIAGSSLSGLLVVWELLEHADTFSKFVAASPSLWWDDFVTARREQLYSEAHASLQATLFMSVGAAEDADQLEGFTQLSAALASRGYSGFELRTRMLNTGDHGDACRTGVNLGIRSLLPAAPLDRAREAP